MALLQYFKKIGFIAVVLLVFPPLDSSAFQSTVGMYPLNINVNWEQHLFDIGFFSSDNYGSYPYCPFEAETIYRGGGNTGKCSQSDAYTMSPLSSSVQVGFAFDLNVNEDFKLVTPDGITVSDEVCAGDKFKYVKGVDKGEYWWRGGCDDSPPIYWVDDLDKFFNDLMDYHNKTITGVSDVCVSYKDLGADGFTDGLTGIPQYKGLSFPYGDACSFLFSDENGTEEKNLDAGILSSDLREILDSRAENLWVNRGLITDMTIPANIAVKKISPREWQIPYSTEDFDSNYKLILKKVRNDISACMYYDGLPSDENYNPLNDSSTPMIPVGSLVCSLSGGLDTNGLIKQGDYYSVQNTSRIQINTGLPIRCTYYWYGSFPNAGMSPGIIFDNGVQLQTCDFYRFRVPSITWNMDPEAFNESMIRDPFWVGKIVLEKNITVVMPRTPKIEVSVAGAENIKFSESNTLRILIKNTGDVNVSIKSVYSKPEGKLVSCDAETLAPGQQAECLLSVTPVQGQGLSIQVLYDYKSCGRSQTGLITKTLIDSKVFRTVLKEQSYLMGVHGQCDNSYYSCYSASEGALFAGYKCFKTANGFYAPATERFNMRFDLSEITKDAQIIGATLHLKASEIGKTQTVQVYSVDKIPEAVKCLPGGDICTKPYCGECKPLFDIAGTLASSTEISTAGPYSFDLTSLLKEKIAGGGIVSLQVRGVEGLWETKGQNSCSIENEWDKLDTSFDAGGREGPYLEIVYK